MEATCQEKMIGGLCIVAAAYTLPGAGIVVRGMALAVGSVVALCGLGGAVAYSHLQTRDRTSPMEGFCLGASAPLSAVKNIGEITIGATGRAVMCQFSSNMSVTQVETRLYSTGVSQEIL